MLPFLSGFSLKKFGDLVLAVLIPSTHRTDIVRTAAAATNTTTTTMKRTDTISSASVLLVVLLILLFRLQ
jgi:hypothetical protein